MNKKNVLKLVMCNIVQSSFNNAVLISNIDGIHGNTLFMDGLSQAILHKTIFICTTKDIQIHNLVEKSIQLHTCWKKIEPKIDV